MVSVKGKSWRVVYGESRPAWEQIFPTKKEARAFAAKQSDCGDIIFSVKKVVRGEGPQSLMAAITVREKEEAPLKRKGG